MARLFFVALLSCCVSLPLSGAPVEVRASQALCIAIVNTPGRDDAAQLQQAFAPRFERAATQIYGATMPVRFVRVSPETACDGLRRGLYDAALVFQPKVPAAIRRARFHVLRAAVSPDVPETSAGLVLRQAEPRLDELLANAFSVALQHAEVQRVLSEHRALDLASR